MIKVDAECSVVEACVFICGSRGRREAGERSRSESRACSQEGANGEELRPRPALCAGDSPLYEPEGPIDNREIDAHGESLREAKEEVMRLKKEQESLVWDFEAEKDIKDGVGCVSEKEPVNLTRCRGIEQVPCREGEEEEDTLDREKDGGNDEDGPSTPLHQGGMLGWCRTIGFGCHTPSCSGALPAA